ncbi:gas vesicle protein GvpG [Pseudanabaena sp. FACHB-2040]|uniref:gas vesicle protein GvpG n=1 Tax=Pseudanabaena sp. FACHB-2040 TaxID=2692859 RepID=UPI0016865A8D|nr:gas vesicle protein GvpG [Pseudanabaena sp. FACHB-2040]MBD2258549.1 gas vesicle protein GvpG [Pseudanabaena sp. FACHB-2040]
MLNLLLLPVTGPLSGVTWVAEKLLEQAEGETNDLEVLQKQLLALQLAFDMGELDEDLFEAQEEELLLAIEDLQIQASEEA